jgi:hypothetical protein
VTRLLPDHGPIVTSGVGEKQDLEDLEEVRFWQEKRPNPTQSEMWRAVSSPAIGNFLSSCSPIVIKPK